MSTSYFSSTSPLKGWTKLWLLICKNKSLQLANPINTLTIILTPILFFMLTQIETLIKNESPIDEPETRYPPLILEKPNVTSIFYSPVNHVVDNVVKEMATYFDKPKIGSYLYASELDVALKDEDAYVGIEFEDHFRNILQMPPKVRIALRFPLHSRQKKNYKWTKQLFKPWHLREDLYAEEGFLYVQIKLFEAIIRTENQSANMPELYIRAFPEAARKTYTSVESGYLELMGTFFLIYMCPSLIICLMIVSEKQRYLRDMMQVMGLSNGLNWISWFIVTFIILMIPTLAILGLMKTFLCLNSSPAVVLLILVVYILSLISLIFVVCAVFSNAFLAMIVLCITNIVTTIPYMVSFMTEIGFLNALVVCLFLNSAMPLIIYQLLGFELYGVGAQWSNMFRRVHRDDPLSYGTIMLIMIFASILCMLLFLYLDQLRPGGFRAPKKWYYPFTRQFYCPSRPVVINATDEEDQRQRQQYQEPPPSTSPSLNRNALIFEDMEQNGSPIIDCQKLSKTFGLKAAVRNLTIQFFENEITVLFGHNGAGKTSIFMMMTGIYPPTSGRVLINGHDMAISPRIARRNLSICPQNNIFFEELSAFWHINFFSRLKGLSRKNAKDEARTYLYKINLRNSAHVKVNKLSTVMRRKLSLCCALCADTKVVLCDEPNAYLDPSESRQVWDLLRSEKEGRCIVINTYNVNAAAVLGDRIGIISEGELIAYGTANFLISNLGPGYRLVCVQLEDCNVWTVTKFLQRKMRQIQIEDVTDTDIVYRLPMEKLSKFSRLFASLEIKLPKLKLASFSVSAPTMDETFLKIGLDKIDTYDALESIASNDWMEDIEEKNKRHRYWNAWHGMLMKKVLFTRHNLIPIMGIIILPLMLSVLILLFNLLESGKDQYYIPSFNDLDLYPGAYVVWEGNTNNDDPYRAVIESSNRRITVAYDHFAMMAGATVISMQSDVEKYMIDNIDLVEEGFSKTFVAGATLREGTVTAWFNRRLVHGKPLSINLLYKAIGSALASVEIEVYNKPRNSSNVKYDSDISANAKMNTLYVLIFLCIAMSIFIMLPIQERVSQMQQQQFISGISLYTYWLSHFIWDYMIFLIFTLSLMLSYYMKPAITFFWLFTLLLVFAFICLPFTYILSYAFKDSTIGMAAMILCNLITVFVAVLTHTYREHNIFQIFHYILMTLPHYTMYMATITVFMQGNTINNCQSLNLPSSAHECDPKSIDQFIVRVEMIIMILGGLIYIIILMVISKFPEVKCVNKYSRQRSQVSMEDIDVLEMRQEIDRLVKNPAELSSYGLVCERIVKKIRDAMPVNSVSFKINPYESFGLLGLSGAGKTLTIESIVGNKKLSQGNIYIKGFNMRTEKQKCIRYIGYCPQENAVLHFMTGREMLQFACLVRGIIKSSIPSIIERLAKIFVFTRFLDQQTVHYSNGTKRKLNIAMAVLSPCLICLDDPITGLDICARHHISMVLSQMRSNGKSLLVTSNSVSDCEVLCSCLAIMVNGRLRCIGSAQHLKSRFNRGISIKIQVCNKDEMNEIRNSRRSNESGRSGNTKSPGSKGSDVKSLSSDVKSSDLNSLDIRESIVESSHDFPVESPTEKSVQVTLKKKKPKDTEGPTTSDRVSTVSGKNDAEQEQSIGRGKLVSKRRKTSITVKSTHGRSRLGSTSFNTYVSSNHEYNLYSLILEVGNQFKMDFPDSYVTEMYSNRGLVTIIIPDRDLKWSQIYKYMEDNRYLLQIKEYSISQTTLEDIFLYFVQRKEDIAWQ